MELLRLPNVGDRFLDRWLIEGEVGKGGFSIVYRATDAQGRVAALKILTPDNKEGGPGKYDTDLADRFVREARVLDQLSSAYTINLWEYGESDDGLLFMAFEFIDGRMLFDEIKQNGPMDEDRVIHVLRQTLIALESSHALGILHRDIKPNNIMLYERDGDPDRVKLVDFGIAKMFDEDKALPGNDLTADGLLVGTPRYMAPEQLKGHDLTPAADLYSLGLCGIEMLSGRKCIPGRDRTKIVERQLGPKQVVIPDDVDVMPELAAIVHRLTAKPLHERYVTATDALRDLEKLAGDPGQTGDTLYQDRPALDELLKNPSDDDETVLETVNSAELAAFLDQQKAKLTAEKGEESEGSIDPFGETMASRSDELLTPELLSQLRANDATVEGLGLDRPQQQTAESPASDFQKSFSQNYAGEPPAEPTMQLDHSSSGMQLDHSSGAIQKQAGDSFGSGQFTAPERAELETVEQRARQISRQQAPGESPVGGGPPSSPDQSYPPGQMPQPPQPYGQPDGSGQFGQPPLPGRPGPPPGAGPNPGPHGSGQFQAPSDGSYGSGQFQQPPGPYGSGQFPNPTPGGVHSGQYATNPTPGGYGSGQFQQPPVDQSFGGSGFYQAPGQPPPPGYGPPGHFPPGPRGPHPHHTQMGPPRLTGDDKLALVAGFVAPGVGQILSGQPVKGAIMMGLVLALVVLVTPWLWAPIAVASLVDTFLLVRARKRRGVGNFEFFADWRMLL